MSKKLTVLRDTNRRVQPSSDEEVVGFLDYKKWLRSPALLKHIAAYTSARMLHQRIGTIPRPFASALTLRLMSRGPVYLEGDNDQKRLIDLAMLTRLGRQWVADWTRRTALLGDITARLKHFEVEIAQPRPRPTLDLSLSPLYLRTDLVFGLKAGGSVGHIAGVLNNLRHFTGRPVFLSTDRTPTIDPAIETEIIEPEERFWDFLGLPLMFFTQTFVKRATAYLAERPLSFIYQRYGVYNYAAVELSRRYAIPLITEYNGSEIWINRNWGGLQLPYEDLATRIEMINLQLADVIVVVSRVMQDELLQRGVARSKILINPNGVDPEMYSPERNGGEIRRKYHLDDKLVLGFIGTFGRWHGAEVLAEAYGKLLATNPQYLETTRLLMIGDGRMMPEVKRRIAAAGVAENCILTGVVPQAEGPAYLAACDILVSPHIPNLDGTPFFGSPTKLFEYMAMGKGIVASDLAQIGEVLKHGETAWMVQPGEVESLVNGLKIMLDDSSLRTRLGQAARNDVLRAFTWRQHTKRIIEALKQAY